MRKPNLRRRPRGGVGRSASARLFSIRRRLQIESLEDRTLLAADLGRLGLAEGEGSDPSTVPPAVVAVDDSYHLEVADAPQVFAVLDNDVNFGGGELSIDSVDAAGALGDVAVAPNGLGVIYTPATGFGGSEQFTYTVSSPAGSSTATVTVHVQPVAALDDELNIRLATIDLEGNVVSSVAAGQEFLVRAYVQDLRGAGIDRGVYAAYFDLLYERALVAVVPSSVTPLGIAVFFGPDYRNGIRGDASVPGVLDEFGSFETETTPLGSGEFLLFSARFRAGSLRGEADSFEINEDQQVTLPVFENDLPNVGTAIFQADPADELPVADSLLYDPVEPVPYERIRYGNTALDITPGSGGSIVSVSEGSAGGSIAIGDGGASLLYVPAPNFNGVETFTYSLDGRSQTQVSVTVLPVNDAPVANEDSYRVRENRTLNVPTNVGVTANDIEYDGDTIGVAVVDDPAHGTLQLATDGSFTYVPEEDYLGHDSFTYQASDGQAESAVTTVALEVFARPVSIRLEAVDSNGMPVAEVTSDESIVVRALVQDLRSAHEAQLGLGAAYLDIEYDPEAIAPATSATGPLGLNVEFGSPYSNGLRGKVLAEGRLDDIGAFQADSEPIGDAEIELFNIGFDLQGPRSADDFYTIAKGAAVSRLNVLENEAEIRWEVTLDAQHATNSPVADVVYSDPVEPVPAGDISYGDFTLAIRNGQLTIQSVGESASGAAVSIDSQGMITYAPDKGFSGQDSFTYSVVDGLGRTAIANVQLEVVESWQNPVQPTDVNGDGFDSPIDALLIVNELNAVGSHELAVGEINAFWDVNGDGIVAPIDVLLVINRLALNESGPAGEGEFTGSGVPTASLVGGISSTPPFVSTNLIARDSVRAAANSPLATAGVVEVFDGAGTCHSDTAEASRHELEAESRAEDWADLLDAIADDVAATWAMQP